LTTPPLRHHRPRPIHEQSLPAIEGSATAAGGVLRRDLEPADQKNITNIEKIARSVQIDHVACGGCVQQVEYIAGVGGAGYNRRPDPGRLARRRRVLQRSGGVPVPVAELRGRR